MYPTRRTIFQSFSKKSRVNHLLIAADVAGDLRNRTECWSIYKTPRLITLWNKYFLTNHYKALRGIGVYFLRDLYDGVFWLDNFSLGLFFAVISSKFWKHLLPNSNKNSKIGERVNYELSRLKYSWQKECWLFSQAQRLKL